MRISAILVLVMACLAASFGPAMARSHSAQQGPTYHVTMVPATIVTINYQHRSGSTTIGFQGSPLLPFAKGRAKVNGKVGRIQINAEFSKLEPAQKFGPEYLTYVLWAITPEGKSNNLGEILLSGDKTKIDVTTSLQTFGLIVTAEPYFAVGQPSNVVVLQNVVLPETVGTIEQAPASYQLLDKGAYSYQASGSALSRADSKVPLELFEAQNAVQIAINSGAQKYAADALNKAQNSLSQAQNLMAKNGNNKLIVQASRDAVQNAADARHIALQKQDDEREAQRRADAAKREADAKAQAAAAAASEAQEAAARQQAEMQRLQAERDAAQAAAATARADTDRLVAQQQAQKAQDAAAQAIREKQQLRAQLLEQFNRVLPTTDTPRGLKVNMADVLFAFGKFDLQPSAREALAKLSGIVLGHPGLKLSVEGYTDSIGTDEVNQTLSEKRAGAVRDYLVQQGVDPASTNATGFGKSNPVASNDTNEGRQQNRRVEIIISGEVIGTQIGGAAGAQPQQ